MGFDIKIFNESKNREVLKKTNEQAKRLTDIITFKREKRVTCHFTELIKKLEASPGRNGNLPRGKEWFGIT